MNLETDHYPIANWSDLEKMTDGSCECCNIPFSATNPPDLAQRCHVGKGAKVAYWDGYLYLRCAKCNQPICKVPVSKSLL